jgi:hypothetical protein
LYREDRNGVADGVYGEEEVVHRVVGERPLRGEVGSAGAHAAEAAGRHNAVFGELTVGLLGERDNLVPGWVVSLDEDRRGLPE